MVEANGLIYVCGGSLGNNVSGRVLNSCEVYDPATETYVLVLLFLVTGFSLCLSFFFFWLIFKM